jgi:type VI secretion system secreted protein Hcp
MAVDMFLDLGSIEGEAQDAVYKGKIDVLSWSWELKNQGTGQTGGGSGTGKVEVDDISITKWADKSTPTIAKFLATGEPLPKVTLIVRKAGKDPLEYIKLEMEKVFITKQSHGGSNSEDKLTEHITLNFAKFKLIYTEQADSGGKSKAPEFGFNIAANAPA